MKKQKSDKQTVLVENVMLSHETGYPEKQTFVLYSAPTSPAMALALAESLKRCNKSYRIMTEDGKGNIIAQWWRDSFIPDDKNTTNKVD